MPIQPIYHKNGPNGLDWQCCLAGSSKTAPRILISSIAMDADYSFDVKNIEIWAPAFFKHNNSFIAAVSFHFLNSIEDLLTTQFPKTLKPTHCCEACRHDLRTKIDPQGAKQLEELSLLPLLNVVAKHCWW